ncbi:MAG: hypothetical protein ACRD9Y_20320 [Blastocatellia bacterium]
MRIVLFIVCCAIAAFAPILPARSNAPINEAAFPGWPATLEGRELKPLPLSSREERFVAGFPGRVGRFTDGRREIIIRWVARETRALHPASDCFKGLGYSIRPLPPVTDESDKRWGVFQARMNDESLRVMERIYSDSENQNGQNWTDVSTWYWQALLGKTSGPWWALTVTERR